MSFRLLLTGGAGYIGGSILDSLLSKDNNLFENNNIIAVVRSEEQARALSEYEGLIVSRLDLTDQKAVKAYLVEQRVNIVVHTASSMDTIMATNLIDGLAKYSKASGQKAFFLHTSGSSAFYEITGWPQGATDDTRTVFETEKKYAESFPLRATDVGVVENAKQQGVSSFIVVPSVVYGRGTGKWNKLSIVIPVLIKSFIVRQAVFKFPEDTTTQGVHISDMVAVYLRILESIVQGKPVESDERGYYFAFAHKLRWLDFLQNLHTILHARDAAVNSEIQVWPSDEAAAESLGVAPPFVQPLWNAGSNIISTAREKLGWQPKWTEQDFMDNIEDDVQNVVDNNESKSSLVQSLNTH